MAEQQEVLRTRLRGVGWEVPVMLARMPQARTLAAPVISGLSIWSAGRTSA